MRLGAPVSMPGVISTEQIQQWEKLATTPVFSAPASALPPAIVVKNEDWKLWLGITLLAFGTMMYFKGK